jgi:hypothetical protein
MKNLLVGKEVKYGAASGGVTETAFNQADLLLGAIGIFGLHSDYNVLVSSTKTTEAKKNVVMGAFVGKHLTFAVGKGNGAMDSKNEVELAGIRSIEGAGYTGNYAYAKVIITPAPAGAPTAVDEYEVTISHKDFSTQQYMRKTYSVQGSFATATALVTAFKAVIDADEDRLFDATGTATLIITSKDKAIDYIDIARSGEYASFATAFTTAQNVSLGDPYFLKQLEKELLANKGTSDQIKTYIPTLGNQVQDGVNYNVYTIDYKNTRFPQGSQKEHFDVDSQLYIALPVPATPANGDGVLEFETVLKALVPSFTRLVTDPA